MNWKQTKVKIAKWLLGNDAVVSYAEHQLETCVSYIVQRAVSEGKIPAEIGDEIMAFVDEEEVVKDFLEWLDDE